MADDDMKDEGMTITRLRYGTADEPLIEHLRLPQLRPGNATIGTVSLQAGQRVPEGEGEAVHDQDEVSVILEGKITLEAEDEETTLETGALVHIPAGVAHSSVAIEDTKVYFMLIG